MNALCRRSVAHKQRQGSLTMSCLVPHHPVRMRRVFFFVCFLAIVVLSLLAVPLGAGAASSQRPASRLLPRARRVASLSKNFRAYCWLARNRVLLVYSDGGDYSELEAITQWQGYAQILDLKTRRKHRLVGFTRLLNQAHGTPGRFETSPDGTWLKWISYETGDGWPCPVVAHLDGSRFQRFSQDNFSLTYWLDNHRWAEQETRSQDGPFQLIIHDVNHPKATQHLPLKSKQAQNLLRLRRNPPVQIPSFSDEGRFLLGNYFDRYSHPIPIHPIRIPVGMEEELPVESRHNGLAYLLSRQVRSASQRFSKQRKSVEVQSLWIRRVDGSGLRQLGYVTGHLRYGTLQWMPDGKQLSFVYRGALYVVPAELGK
jgi:hypothetical protein